MSNRLHPCSISSKESENTLVLQPIPSRIGITTTNGITMTNAIIESIVSRSTTKYFDPAVTLSDDQIRVLVRIATTAPTSFHMQNWRFIAVRTPEAKARLSPIAWNQPAITEAAVTFIVCGQLADSSVIPGRWHRWWKRDKVSFRRFSIHLLSRFNPCVGTRTPQKKPKPVTCCLPQPGCSRRWLESEGVQDQGARG